MKNILPKIVEDQIQYYENLLTVINNSLTNVPEGYLRIDHRPYRTSYYHCGTADCSGRKNGIYIKKENMELAKALAQKSYDLNSKKEIEQLLEYLGELRKNYNENPLYELYDHLTPQRKELVSPLLISDNEFVSNWKTAPYSGKNEPFENKEIKSFRNESMRSKSEVLIANLLDRYGVPYRYEYPLVLDNDKVFYPDFLVLNKRTRMEYYWEHFGMMGNPDYSSNVVSKIGIYAQNGYLQGINMIYTFESSDNTLNISVCDKYIRQFLL